VEVLREIKGLGSYIFWNPNKDDPAKNPKKNLKPLTPAFSAFYGMAPPDPSLCLSFRDKRGPGCWPGFCKEKVGPVFARAGPGRGRGNLARFLQGDRGRFRGPGTGADQNRDQERDLELFFLPLEVPGRPRSAPQTPKAAPRPASRKKAP